MTRTPFNIPLSLLEASISVVQKPHRYKVSFKGGKVIEVTAKNADQAADMAKTKGDGNVVMTIHSLKEYDETTYGYEIFHMTEDVFDFWLDKSDLNESIVTKLSKWVNGPKRKEKLKDEIEKRKGYEVNKVDISNAMIDMHKGKIAKNAPIIKQAERLEKAGPKIGKISKADAALSHEDLRAKRAQALPGQIEKVLAKGDALLSKSSKSAVSIFPSVAVSSKHVLASANRTQTFRKDRISKFEDKIAKSNSMKNQLDAHASKVENPAGNRNMGLNLTRSDRLKIVKDKVAAHKKSTASYANKVRPGGIVPNRHDYAQLKDSTLLDLSNNEYLDLLESFISDKSIECLLENGTILKEDITGLVDFLNQ